MSMDSLFVVIWLGYFGIMIVAIAVVVWWAIRNKQFTDQDRARYIPLLSPPMEKYDKPRKCHSKGKNEP